MPQPPNDPVLNGFVSGVSLLSIAACIYLFSIWRRGPVLPFAPRRPVPWGSPAAILAVMFVLMALLSSFSAGAGDAPIPDQDSTDVAARLLGFLTSQLALIGPFVFVVIVMSRATPRDLGLPASLRGFARDVSIGVVACLAALAPVVMLQTALMYLFQMKESGHELVKMVTDGKPNVLVLVLASVAAVVIAPLCEEVTFRLFLQGWLEKWEDAKLGWRSKATVAETSAGVAEACPPENDEASMRNDEVIAADSSFDDCRSEIMQEPPARGIAGLPYGWLPILISSLLFAAAHFGYGPDPVPLFFLALVLGYVYQRTHRIVPCIVIHALFNGFTMVILWRMVWTGAK